MPLSFSDFFTVGFEFPKTIVFRTGVLLLLLVFLLRIIFEKKIELPRLFYKSYIFISAFLLILLLGISTAFSIAPIASLLGEYSRQQGYISFLFYFVFFILLLLNLKTKKQILRIFVAITLTGAAVATYGILQKFGFDPFFRTWITDQFLGRIFSTIGQPNALGQFLILALPITMSAAIFARRSAFFLGSSLVMIAALVFTLSRSSVLGFACAIFIALILLSYYYNRVRLRIAGLCVLLVFLAPFSFANIFSTNTFVSENKVLSRFTLTGENVRSIQSRMYIWPAAIKMFQEKPVIGNGLGLFPILYPKYLDSRIYNYENLHSTVDKAHNEVLDMAVSSGILGVLLYISIFIILFVEIFKFVKKKPKIEDLFFVLPPSLGIFGLFVSNIFGFSLTTHWMFFWLYLAMLISLLSPKESKKLSLSFFKYLPVKIIACTISVLLIGILFTFTVLKPTFSEFYFRKGRLTHSSDYEFTARNYYKKAISYAPWVDRYYYWNAEAVLGKPTKGTLYDALVLIEKIPNISGRNLEYLLYKARLLDKYAENYDKEKTSEAFEAFFEAIAYSPENPRPRYFSGNAYFRRGEFEKAIEAYEAYLKIVPEYWKWKYDINTFSFENREKYRIFYKLNPTFNQVFERLRDAYKAIGNKEKANFYDRYTGTGF